MKSKNSDHKASPHRRGLRRLPARWASLVMSVILSGLMTCLVSLISTLRNVGVPDDFLPLWLGAWGLSWIVAFPLLLVVLPFAKMVTGRVVEPP